MAILSRLRRGDSSKDEEANVQHVPTATTSRYGSFATTASIAATPDRMPLRFQRFRRASKNSVPTSATTDDVLHRPVAALDPQKLSFFDLPPEIRNVVYQDLASGMTLIVPSTLSTPQSARRKQVSLPTGLLLASKQCRREFLPLLFATARVRIQVRDFYFKPVMRVAGSLYSTELKALRENPSLIINLRTQNCAREHLATLRKWLVHRSNSLDKLPWSYEVEVAPTGHDIGRVRQLREVQLYTEDLRRLEGGLEESLQWELAVIIEAFRHRAACITAELSEAGVEVAPFSTAHIRGLSGGGIR